MKNNRKDRSTNIYQYYLKMDKCTTSEERATIKTKVNYFVDRMYDDSVLESCFARLSDAQLAEIIYCYDKSPLVNRNWLDDISKFKEYNFISIINKQESCSSDYISKFELYKETHSEENKILDFIESTFKFMNDYGNPLRKKSAIMFENYMTDIEYTPYYDILEEYNNISNMVTSEYFDKFALCFFELFSNCADEIIRTIYVFFDHIVFDPPYKDRLRDVTLKNTFKLTFNTIESANASIEKEIKCISKVDDVISNYQYYLFYEMRRRKRDEFYNSLAFLKQRKNSPVMIIASTPNNKKGYTKDYARKIITQNESSNSKTFRANSKFLDEFISILHLSDPYELNRGIPRPSIVLDTSLFVVAELIFSEFLVLGNEHINKSLHEKSKMNITISNMMKNCIQTVYSKDGNKLFNRNKCIYLYNDDKIFYDKNEQEDVIFNQMILMTEKIRCGFYSVSEKMDVYRDIYDSIVDVRKTIASILQIRDLKLGLSLLYRYYSEIIDILNECGCILKNETYLTIMMDGYLNNSFSKR